jgi:cerevisin
MGDDGTGSGSDIISGVNFVVQAVASSNRSSVINMSLTTPGSQAIDEAVANAVSFGIHVVVAAGNENADAGQDSPARSSSVIAVGATDINDKRASFSNFGPDVDIWAPGVGIISLGITDDTAVKTLDGTSMASPFVAGLVAYLLILEGNMSPASMKQTLRSITTDSAISGLRKLVHTILCDTIADFLFVASNTTNVLAFNGEDLFCPEYTVFDPDLSRCIHICNP